MKKRLKKIFKRAAEFFKLAAYIRSSDYTDKWFFHERKGKNNK